MIATQYKIILPSDYDMIIITDRVKNNGYITDGFGNLKLKLYLITEKRGNNSLSNSYSPFFLLYSPPSFSCCLPLKIPLLLLVKEVY
ncbi:hypothetical protein Cpap_4017 [Ruminiclostridium papyrosolvens DSM 2782]|jgi:hypothetical protein|uniref:Uncharacterized protein n=1 Tax=Ruminiclostridium papyrosolvens DSM 2782 TaxID=588581 RepID=F1T7Y1_9FIRM|nr:DUF4865 family protein [Ruminiclostridium papyrosolvens]EGD49579.1 hypothetical protein Cpap_4017 [Ruminiclostridium papyrosolvens DSM 2782]WES33295.1 DUF4865 family protein [Ruminiclostridium papyrosolvens DSM 2782]